MKYRVTAFTKVEVVCLVEADSEEEAIELCDGKEAQICIHGSEMADGLTEDLDFVLTDGTHNEITDHQVEEYE